MFGMGTGSGSSLEPPGRRRTDCKLVFFSVFDHLLRLNPLGGLRPERWAWEMRTIKIERAIRTGKLNASLVSALTHPAYQRGGLPRLLRENSF